MNPVQAGLHSEESRNSPKESEATTWRIFISMSNRIRTIPIGGRTAYISDDIENIQIRGEEAYQKYLK